MGQKTIYLTLLFVLTFLFGMGQEVAYNHSERNLVAKANEAVAKGRFESAYGQLVPIVEAHPYDREAMALLARSYSWAGRYDKAREVFNTLTSEDRYDRGIWISAIKNELYAANNATALGLANKALVYMEADVEIERLRIMAEQRVASETYPEAGWFNQNSEVGGSKAVVSARNKKARSIKTSDAEPADSAETQSDIKTEKVDLVSNDSIANNEEPETIVPKTPVDKDMLNNRLSIRNAVTVFDQRYEPIIASSVSFKRQTMAGSLIPRINYNNRRGINGVQYDLDFYPKFSKRFYAYMNYGYSAASIYPTHKMGGDLYANLPGAMEFSAGGRHIIFQTRDVSVVTNSIGHYRGNYYFSLRSYVTPLPDRLTRVSGNLLVRKYGRDAENYMGINVGMGYSPELRQLTAGDELLAETLLYVESQRLSLEYQFTPKKSPNIYRANMGVTRQELAFDSGNYFWSINAGFTYQVKF